MERHNIFSPFYYKANIADTKLLQQVHLEAMLINYNAFPHHSHDWNVHTSYSGEQDLPYKINYEHFFLIYQHYVDEFCLNHFGAGQGWDMDTMWYNVYGKEQDGMQHNHIGADFSAVHYLKFNSEHHRGTTFINNPHSLHPQILFTSLKIYIPARDRAAYRRVYIYAYVPRTICVPGWH
jgi:uncharacterized protein YozE (UPF0346 family)